MRGPVNSFHVEILLGFIAIFLWGRVICFFGLLVSGVFLLIGLNSLRQGVDCGCFSGLGPTFAPVVFDAFSVAAFAMFLKGQKQSLYFQTPLLGEFSFGVLMAIGAFVMFSFTNEPAAERGQPVWDREWLIGK